MNGLTSGTESIAPVTASNSGGRRRQLTTRAVDVRASGVTHGGRHAEGAQPAHELMLDARVRCGPPGARRRVQRDRVDMDPPSTASVELGAQQVSTPALVVHAPDQGVLDADP